MLLIKLCLYSWSLHLGKVVAICFHFPFSQLGVMTILHFFLPSQLYDWKAAAQAGECKVHHRKSFCKVFPVAFVILYLHSVLEIICYLLIFIILAAGEFPISCGVQMFP